MQKQKRVETHITVLIPSKFVDDNLKNCVKKIRKFYKKIRIILILDKPSKFKFDKNVKIVISGNKSIGFKRNLGAKYVKSSLMCLIDSDAYPNSFWLNESLNILNEKKIAAAGGPNLSPKTSDIEKNLVGMYFCFLLLLKSLPSCTCSPKNNKELIVFLFFKSIQATE